MGDINKNMVFVKAGSFKMGDTRNDIAAYESEKPWHTVNLKYNFWVGKYPVTFKQFNKHREIERKSDPDYKGYSKDKRPIVCVTWFDAIGYCNWLSEKKGLPVAYNSQGDFLDEDGNITFDITKVKGFRLLTEAEWEYVAKEGKSSLQYYRYSGSDNIDEVAWYIDNCRHKLREVGLKKPNSLGVYDMSGNVNEWCHDWWDEKYYDKSPIENPIGPETGTRRVLRGGSVRNSENLIRITRRDCSKPEKQYWFLGFRIARTDN